MPFDCTNSNQTQIKVIGDGWSPCHKTGPSPKHLYDCRAYKPLVIMSKTIPTCRRCNTALNSDNWYRSFKDIDNKVCKSCCCDIRRERRHLNKEKARIESEKDRRRRGVKSMRDNKSCAKWLGVHVAEQVLYNVFKDVVLMPHDNPGYDFVCGRNYLIDVKSSCERQPSKKSGISWKFHINRNTIADYFLCLAFDNRTDLTPQHLWLIPGPVIHNRLLLSISASKLQKWDEYKLDINKVITCCNTMKK